MAPKKKKVIQKKEGNKFEHTLKIVTSDTCIKCKQQCKRGLNYIEKMSEPGAVGYGVPCHLTKGKGF
ncbi:hypothetical protein ACJ2A9_01950 [Anaerobacillus sp. MEB173]|uniref:hypothetical protein n=1 Tax=Anaerobacillus sp. MEB173 TaxID=3383345 RepID=UPI003F92DF86